MQAATDFIKIGSDFIFLYLYLYLSRQQWIVLESGSGFTSFQSLDIEKEVHSGLYRNPMIFSRPI